MLNSTAEVHAHDDTSTDTEPALSIADRVRERHKDDKPIPQWGGVDCDELKRAYKAIKDQAEQEGLRLTNVGIDAKVKSDDTAKFHQLNDEYEKAKLKYVRAKAHTSKTSETSA